jgi:cob(I)alamin adenosyltransferase
MKLSRHMDEVCYPFILETSYLCDYEVATDELATLIGMALCSLDATADAGLQDLATDLAQVQPLAFHLNGSAR